MFQINRLGNVFKNGVSRLISTRCLMQKQTQDDFNIRFDREYDKIAETCFDTTKNHSCFIIHPYVKWGPKKIIGSTPDNQLQEAVALIRTLSSWEVIDTIAVPLENLSKNQLLGSGTADTLKERVRSDKNITAVFINMSTLKNAQLEELVRLFKVPVFDRYEIVLQILKLHAISKHAKLQVALAEVAYLKRNLKKHYAHMVGGDFDIKRLMFLNREQKIKAEIQKLRTQRELLRKKRREKNYPVVAVVGYTNAGKTSLIKALTGDAKLNPKDQLFTTLDVTVHSGLLKSNLEILYVDTVGFISNIPTNLIECFIATLEDAIFADIILHVEDLSSADIEFQRKHVLTTLNNLARNIFKEKIADKLISVGNKCDLTDVNEFSHVMQVSALTGVGLDSLKEELEERIKEVTGRNTLTLKIPIGGDEARWLYKHSCVVDTNEDPDDGQFQRIKIIITETNLAKFKHLYITRGKKY